MSRVIYLPLEPLNERYTGQWYRWFPEEFERRDMAFQAAVPNLTMPSYIQSGKFLDTNSTMQWKADQVAIVARMLQADEIHNDDVLFVADAEMFGMEATLAYLLRLNKKRTRMVGFAHAGSYTYGDFVQSCSPWAQHVERAWGEIYSAILVGSNYHRTQLARLRQVPGHKIVVTGNPYKVHEVRGSFPFVEPGDREMCVVHTNRPDEEKNPCQTLAVFAELHVRHPDWKFIVTTSRSVWGSGRIREMAMDMQQKGILTIAEGLSKADYLNILSQARVMTGNTTEENFGYCVLEAMTMGTIPIVENNYSHPELVPDSRCLFEGLFDQVQKIEAAMANPFDVLAYANTYENSFGHIVSVLKENMG